jgi:DHA2 family integral membrane protein (MFS transporter)
MPQWVIEIMMVGFGVGMGLVMTPATNAIMSAVPREKAGAGSAVNNTVRQVAGALGVAILGSLLAVVFRSHLGSDAPAQLANRLDQPAAVVSKLPADARVGTYVKKDASESIGGSLEYVGKAAGALQERGKLAGTPPTSAQQAQAQQAIGEFVDKSKDSFMSAMRVASVVSGLIGLLGAVGAFLFLPTRREHAEQTTNAPATDEPALAH